MLTKLAVHYYRPDFTEAQAKSQISDMLVDLKEFTLAEVENAINGWRQMVLPPGKVKYFPDSGQLRGLVFEARKHRAELERLGPPVPTGNRRPHLWFMLPKTLWHQDWKEWDVPAGELIKDETGAALRLPERVT